MADEITAGQALIELRATSDKLTADMAAVSKLITGELAKVEKEAANVGMAGLAKQIEDVAKATQAAQSQIQNLRFAAIADEVGQLTSALKGAESGVQVTEDLARAESLLEDRFAMVRAEIERQASAQRGLVDEETLLERTTLQLEAAQRQHDQALATVRGRAIQAAEGIAQLEAEEQASALAATKAWEATAQLAIEQDRATKEATDLAAAEARTAQGLANLGTAITHAAEETQKANARWAAMKPTLTGVVDAAQAAGLAFGAFAGGVATVAGVSAKLTMEAAHIGESFNDLAIKTSTTVEALSRYDLAAKTADVSQETLAVGMRKLAQAAVEAGDDGSESAQAFKSLGVEVRDANGNIKPMGQLLQETTRALADAGDGAETMASAQQLLGRSAQDFLPLAKMTKEELDDLAKASEELGLVWSTKDAAAADKLSDSVTVLGAGVKGLGLSIGRDLIPVAQQVVDESLSWLRANSELMRSGFKDWVFGVKQIIEGLAPLVRDTADAFLWWGGGLDDTFGGLNQQIVDTEAKMKDLKRTMETPLMATGEVDKATKEYEHLALQLEGLKVRAEQAKNVQAPLASAVEGTTTALRDQKIVAKETGEQFDAMLINWEDANKAAEEAKRAQKEAAAEAKRLSDVNRGLADSIEQLKLDALSDDLDDATAALERNRSVVADESYLRALQDIQAAYESQVETIKRTTEEAVAAGADRTLAAEREALAVESAQRDMAQAVEKLDGVLVKNADYWGDVGKVVADLPPEMRALIPTLDAVALATGNVSEATKEAATDLVKLDGIASDLAKGLAQAITGSADWRGVGDAILAKTLDATFTQGIEDALNDTFIKAISEITDPVSDAMSTMFKSAFNAIADPLKEFGGEAFAAIFGDAIKDGVAGASSFAASAAAFLPVAGAAYGGLALAFGNKNVGKEASMVIAGEVGAMVSVGAAVGIGAALGTPLGPVGVAIGAGVGFIAGALASAFGVDRPDMRERIATEVEKQIGKALAEDVNYQAVLDAGLAPLGYELTAATARSLMNASRSNDLLRQQAEVLAETYGADFMAGFSPAFTASVNKHGASSTEVPVSDWVRAFFPDSDVAAQAYATELAKSLASVEVAGMGLTGADAVTMTEQVAAGYVNLAQSTGMSIDEFVKWMETSNQAAGMSTRFFQTLDELNGAMVAQGVSIEDVVDKIGMFTGMDLSGAGNLVDLFIASGESADTFVKQLEKIGDSDPALRQLIDSMDPPLVDALAAVEDGGNAAAKAIGKLTGQANTSLAGAEARILAFGDALFEVAEDGSKQLNTLGEELNSELQAGISGIEDAIKEEVNSAAGLTSETLGKAFSELQGLAALPAEALDDSTTAAIEHLKAVIQAATGWTAEQVDQMIATATAVPPPVQPVPPETTASLDGAAESTGEIAENSAAAATAADDLTSSTQATGAAAGDTAAAFEDLATRALAALDGLIGTVGDDAGLLSLEDLIRVRIPDALVEAEAATLGATGVIHDSFDYARGAVLMLTDAINAIPRDITTTVHVVQDGSANVTPVEIPTSHTGELIPGMPGEETLRILEAGELVIPADAVAAMGRGAFDIPASMVSRLSYPVGVPSLASVAGAGAAASTPALDSEWTALPVRKRDLIEGAVLEVARATETGRARIDGRRFRVSPTYGRRR